MKTPKNGKGMVKLSRWLDGHGSSGERTMSKREIRPREKLGRVVSKVSFMRAVDGKAFYCKTVFKLPMSSGQ